MPRASTSPPIREVIKLGTPPPQLDRILFVLLLRGERAPGKVPPGRTADPAKPSEAPCAPDGAVHGKPVEFKTQRDTGHSICEGAR